MLGWLKSLVARWRDSDRLIFRYWDGEKWRGIDPFAAYRAVMTTPNFLSWVKTVTTAQGEGGASFYPPEMIFEAEDNLRNMTRQIFDVNGWTEEQPGLTLQETDLLLNRFISYCDDLKKKLKASPTSSAPSDSTEPVESLDGDGSPPGAESACASIAIALSAGVLFGP